MGKEREEVDLHKVEKPAVAVDVILFTIRDGRLEVGLIKREDEPYRGKFALPGRFVRYLEPIEDTARKALESKGAIDPHSVYLEQLYTFGQNLERDTRIRTISIVYYGFVRWEDIANQQGNKFIWQPAYDLPEMGFDHRNIVLNALERIKSRVPDSDIAFKFLPNEFTLTELQHVHEQILNQQVDKRNFRRRILQAGVLKDLKKKKLEGVHRPATLYSYKRMTR